MKKLLLYAFAAIVALASCTKDPNGPRKIGEQVTYGLSLSSDEAMSFYNDAQARHDMEAGGIKNVDPSQFFIRYVIDLYYKNDGAFAHRYERLVDFTAGSGTKFNLRVPTDQYHLAVWADFVPREGRQASPVGGVDIALDPDEFEANDYFYNTNFDGDGLLNVDIRPDMFNEKNTAIYKGGGRMSRDAYCGTMSFDLINGKQDGSLNLKRILGRVAVYGRNMDADRLAAANYTVPDSVVVTYPGGTYYSNYNVLTGKPINASTWGELVYGHKLTAEDNPVVAEGKLGTVTFPDLQLLTFDYLFPTVDGNKTSFSIKYFSEGAEIMGIGTEVVDRTIASNKQQRLVADVYDDDHQFVAVAKDADGKVIPVEADKLLDVTTALAEAIAMTPSGGTVKLYAGNYKSTGLTIDKSISIEGVEGKSVIYGENLTVKTTSAGFDFGQYPILFIKGPDTRATPMNVAIKGVNFTIKNTPYPDGFDGLVVDGHAGLTIQNSVFDGIGNTNGNNYQSSGNQYGRCISVMGGATLTADKCTFKKFNKNAVDVFAGSSAALSNCTVTGDNYNAQNKYNSTGGTAEEKDIAAYGGSPIQNGFVFRTGTTGSVTGCTFTNIRFGLDKGLRRAKNDQSRAVYLYEPGTTTIVTGENDETNIYTNCELNWSAWTATPPSSDATLSWIKVNNNNVTGFDPATLTYNVNVATDVTSATVTAEKADFYADMTISPAVSTPLEVGVPVTFTINTKSEDGMTILAYTVNVTRAASTDATLSSLKLNGTTVTDFSATKYTYDIEVPNNQTTASVTATKTHDKATVVVSPEAEQQLTVGVKVPFTVTVTAEDGTTILTYTVNVTRAASTDASLSNLQLNGATVTDFNATKYTYDIEVPNDKTTALVTATKTHDNATVVVSPSAEQQLTVGVKVPFTVTVTAEDGKSTHTYTVNVTRKGSSNTRWSGFSLNGLPATGFDANQTSYTSYVPNSTATAMIIATAEDPNARVAVTPSGAADLVPGVAKVFSVVVTAQDGTTFTYTVNVTREAAAVQP